MPNSRNQEVPWWIALPVSIFIGIILVASIPGAKEYFEQILSMVLAVIFLGIIVGAIILGVFWFLNREYHGY